MKNNPLFLQKAKALTPELVCTRVSPVGVPDWREKPLHSGDSLCLDFGNHFVGHLELALGYTGSHPDAPAWIQIQFAERLSELLEDITAYNGWVSKGWIQQEQLHVDILPTILTLPRRYAFRYVRLTVLDVSSKYSLTVRDCACLETTSAGEITPLAVDDPMLESIDRVACRTLRNCMQTVFEDGPKRDRRLWLGDLRLQALANYETFRKNNLVKRCLYLFAGSTLPDGRVSACIFTEPEAEADDTVMFDYSLLFIPTLRDYYRTTGDLETLRELWQTAHRQAELAQSQFDDRGIVLDSDKLGWCFLDWNLALNKQAGAQGVYLYCMKALAEMAEILGENAAHWQQDYACKRQAAIDHLWDGEKQVFVSGAEKQVSWASQLWLILADVLPESDALSLLNRLPEMQEALPMVTPYLYHHYLEALVKLGQKDTALNVIRNYWGGMVHQGADTFWELYNPSDPGESPYGGTIVNSYCHAWSCTPAYFLRRGLI